MMADEVNSTIKWAVALDVSGLLSIKLFITRSINQKQSKLVTSFQGAIVMVR
jgi:hypothetical protein